MPSLNVTQKSAIVYFNTPEGVDLCGQEGTVVALTANPDILTDSVLVFEPRLLKPPFKLDRLSAHRWQVMEQVSSIKVKIFKIGRAHV